MNAPSISVIVPVYNSAAYLVTCLDSIVGQKADFAYEVVCIDDGSTDDSTAILAEYAAKYAQLEVITQENQGLSGARNTGIEASRGDYILFVDSDDALVSGALEQLYEKASADNLDVLFFDAQTLFDNEELEEKFPGNREAYVKKHPYPQVESGIELFDSFIENDDYQPPVWLLLVSRKLLDDHGLRFERGLLYEDNIFTLSALLAASRTGHLPETLYLYYVHPDSITTRTPSKKNVQSAYTVLRQVVTLFVSRNLDARTQYCAAKEIARLIDQVEYLYDLLPEDRMTEEILPPIDQVFFDEMTATRRMRHLAWHLEGDLEWLKKDYARLQSENTALSAQIDDLWSSCSMKVGRVLTALPRGIRGMISRIRKGR